MRRVWWVGAVVVLFGTFGCVNVKAPERINIGSRPPPVDSARVPQTGSLQECQVELERAYQNIQHLEGENEKLRRKADELKRERDQYKKRLEKYED